MGKRLGRRVIRRRRGRGWCMGIPRLVPRRRWRGWQGIGGWRLRGRGLMGWEGRDPGGRGLPTFCARFDSLIPRRILAADDKLGGTSHQIVSDVACTMVGKRVDGFGALGMCSAM